jgi:DNA-binding IclR family transcriptional regulator
LGFVYQDVVTKRYTLGPRVLELGAAAREQLSMDAAVSVPLLRLVNQTEETATFSLYEGPWRVCVSVIEGPSDLRQVARAGARYPLPIGAAGKAILAHLPEALCSEILATHKITGKDAQRIVKQLEVIREAHLSMASGERVDGASAIAAPVFVRGWIYGSIAATGPTERMQPIFDRIAPYVKEAAETITRNLAGSPTG